VQLLKKKNHLSKLRLLKDEKIEFSANRFLVNKWLFAKTNEHFRLVQGYICSLRGFTFTFTSTFYENFKVLRLNLNEQRASEKKAFFLKSVFYFFSIELIDRVNCSTSHFIGISNTYIFCTEFFSI